MWALQQGNWTSYMAAQGFQKFLRPKVALSEFYHILLAKVVIG